MGRIGLDKSGNFDSSSANGFFSLKDDGDSAVITLLYDDPEGNDIDYFVVHKAEIDGRERYVNCLAISEDGEQLEAEACPLCSEGFPRTEKLFLQLYNDSTGQVETWDRGRAYVQKIITFINKYGALVTQPFEIVRNGRRGDTKTTYEWLPERSEPDATLEDYPEKSELLGTLILDLNEDQLYDVVDGKFSLEDGNRRSNRGGGRDLSPRRGSYRGQEPRGGASRRQASGPSVRSRGRF